MPALESIHNDHLLYCRRLRRIVSVTNCYRCPYYIKRDDRKVFCKHEIETALGSRVRVIERNPRVVVETRVGGKRYEVDIDVESDAVVFHEIGAQGESQ